jgi:hypothetical protein
MEQKSSNGVEWVFGALAGAVFMAVVQVTLDLLFARQAFRDGQYAFSFFITMPFGAVAGGLVGGAYGASRRGDFKSAGGRCSVGGILMALLVAAAIPTWDFHYVPWVAALYALAFGLFVAGGVFFNMGVEPGARGDGPG